MKLLGPRYPQSFVLHVEHEEKILMFLRIKGKCINFMFRDRFFIGYSLNHKVPQDKLNEFQFP